MDVSLTLNDKINTLPLEPGIYLFKNKKDVIIYIGKAKILKNRVRSYFQNTLRNELRINELIYNINDLDWIITLNESDALILEDQLIKLHKPKYNIQLKDNKTFPYIKITVNERYPRLFLTRKIEKDNSRYYGPYSSIHDARSTIKAIHKYFPLRNSKMDLDGGKTYRPCLNFHLKRCLAPCRGNVKVEVYQNVVNKVQKLLSGDYRELINELTLDMHKRALNLDYESAANNRDQINAVKSILEKKPDINSGKFNIDVYSIIRKNGFVGVQLLFIRQGIVIGGDFNLLKGADFQNDNEIIRSLFSRHYIGVAQPPPEYICVPEVTDEIKMIEQYISKLHKHKISVLIPTKKSHKKAFKICLTNANANLKLHISNEKTTETIITNVKKELKLKYLPKIVECYDISNIQGTNNVASLIVFDNNQPDKKKYKRYKIKSFEGIDDSRSMAEVILRRVNRGKSGENKFPNLILIDGGVSQLNGVLKIIKENIGDDYNFDIISLAKGRSEKKRYLDKNNENENYIGAIDFEYIIKPDKKDPIRLNKSSLTLHYLQRIRDEAHRFANNYHTLLRKKQLTNSTLIKIPGIGQQKKKMLLLSIGGINEVKRASIERLTTVPGISTNDAQNIHKYFHN